MQRLVIAFLVIVAASVPAAAQTAAAARPARPLFLDLNAAFEGAAPALETTSTFTLFGEPGATATSQQPGASLMADARVGYRVAERFAVAFGFAGGRSEALGKTAATVPSAIRFASPTVVTLDAPGLKRREADYHLEVLWYPPVTLLKKASLVVGGGPTFIKLQQSVPSLDPGTQGASLTVANEKGSGVGFHATADLIYPLSERLGVGVFARYVAGHLDLPSAEHVKVGGIQAGGGVRLRF